MYKAYNLNDECSINAVRFKDLLDDVYTDLSNLLKSSGQVVCSIVYCLERSTCDDLSLHLSKNGISSAAYHAGLNSKMRSTVLDDWLSSRILVVVATVAFGYFTPLDNIYIYIYILNLNVVCDYRVLTERMFELFAILTFRSQWKPSIKNLEELAVISNLQEACCIMAWMTEFILSNGIKKKSPSLSSSDELLKKPLTDFKQMVDYCEGSGCRRRKILQNFGEQVSASLCQKSCDACKYPSLLGTNLADLKRNGNIFRKGGLTPVFLQR
ncbi:ATP-dependent DNA helicase Q-like 3 [Dendrobium catenatum]|uniref:ATP-dependent DNA helicase Q-like 3 n=1 Tax=Dendrobium catenatum TaxID=906689 RepID=A0A2I0W647_9ASPA|nr:ATP-dependent DNA helicase Q-like 3 [Dendrobium catenatum]